MTGGNWGRTNDPDTDMTSLAYIVKDCLQCEMTHLATKYWTRGQGRFQKNWLPITTFFIYLYVQLKYSEPVVELPVSPPAIGITSFVTRLFLASRMCLWSSRLWKPTSCGTRRCLFSQFSQVTNLSCLRALGCASMKSKCPEKKGAFWDRVKGSVLPPKEAHDSGPTHTRRAWLEEKRWRERWSCLHLRIRWPFSLGDLLHTR